MSHAIHTERAIHSSEGEVQGLQLLVPSSAASLLIRRFGELEPGLAVGMRKLALPPPAHEAGHDTLCLGKRRTEGTAGTVQLCRYGLAFSLKPGCRLPLQHYRSPPCCR